MPRRDMIDNLRNMIREMEQRKPGRPSLPAPPRLPHVPRLSQTGTVRDVVPSSCSSEDRERLRTIRAVYPSGMLPELRMPGADGLLGFRSLEPRLSSLDGWLYLDIETTGLAGAATVPFLVGFGEWTGGDFEITQLFLKDRSGEDFLLEEVGKRLSEIGTLVTFNGKAFDVPVLWARFTMCGMRPPPVPAAHLDLLSLVRNMGKRPPYGQSLKEAVKRFTGTIRDGDIPGHLIPALYFIYEREGDASVLEPVVKHNRLDVLDMACLVSALYRVVSGDPSERDSDALGGAGKLHLRKGNLGLAKRCITNALQGASGTSGPEEVARTRLLGQVLRREGDWMRAAEAFNKVVVSGQAKDDDYLWLSRCYELGACDIPKSREVVAAAIQRYETRGSEPPLPLLRRMRRLEAKLKARQKRRQADRDDG